MAAYFHQNDPSHHMVTTSFWPSFPNMEFWSNPSYSDVDYADLHAYSLGLAGKRQLSGRLPRPNTLTMASNSAQIDGANHGQQSITPRGLVIHGPGEWTVRYWMKADNFSAACPYNTTGGMQRVRWMVDGGTYNGGKEGVVPSEKAGQDFICTSPGGSYDWKQFSSDKDRDGNAVPVTYRLVLADVSRTRSLFRSKTTAAEAIRLISRCRAGQPIRPGGAGDRSVRQHLDDEDTAWYNAAYSLLLGPGSPVGVNKKPLVRGETGLANDDQSSYNANLNATGRHLAAQRHLGRSQCWRYV